MSPMSIQLPTSLSRKQLAEFKKLALKHYNLKLTDKEALEDGLDLIHFVGTVLDVAAIYGLLEDDKMVDSVH